MAMICTICNHPERLRIDRMIVEGISNQKIAKQFTVDSQAVWRHSQNHLSRQLVQAYEKKELAESMDLLSRIEDILSKAKNIFDRNYEAKKDDLALRALSEQRNTIELLAKIAAFLHESRAMELQRQQGGYEFKRKEEEQERITRALDRLNPAEQDLWIKLIERIEGLSDVEVVPSTRTIWPDEIFTRNARGRFEAEEPEEPITPETPEPEPMKRSKHPFSIAPIEPTRLEPYKKD